MTATYTQPVQALVDSLGTLPGIGPKSAQRIAFYLLRIPKNDAASIAASIAHAVQQTQWCQRCFNFADGPNCPICADTRRDPTTICIVEEARDLVAVEKTREFNGIYHVLQGCIDPMQGIGPDQLRVKELLTRIGTEPITEAIVCTNPNIEGEATAMYLGRILNPLGINVTRIASGLPVGGDLEYADELTLGRALEGRNKL